MFTYKASLTETLISTLLHSKEITSETMKWADYLDIDLTSPRIVCIIEMESDTLEVMAERTQIVQQWLIAQNKQNLVIQHSFSQLVLLAPALNSDDKWDLNQHITSLQQLINYIEDPYFTVTVAIGRYVEQHNAIPDIATSYQTAKVTLQVGKMRYPDKKTHIYQDFILPILFEKLKQSWEKEELDCIMQKLQEADENGILRNTLFTWFENNMQSVSTANMLNIHRNSLEYRLNKIVQITGLNLSNTADKVLLYIALYSVY
ncbi:helix-turn-helix domain-containing protein [Phocoenobacter skyensis]|nr:helix-turn-helix domain-containing protein [Pasteurella skyensis]MDP8079385.1 helix-turn-helix domain-containing protein [Pasteurella skyensis]MDP8085257.1 helix-turn-helix domain-containing protein [Pasteurella skyensis]MDP8184316.1 helix-turn-helix domain-containing protein [Pasteurella skyensis]